MVENDSQGNGMFAQVLKWVAIIMMIDSGIGILGLRIWKRRLAGIDVEKIALIEAALAVVLLGISFAL